MIEATDPYFNAEVHKVEIPLSGGKMLENLSVSSCVYTGECAIVNYAISYAIPEEVQKKAMSMEETGEVGDTGIDEYYEQGTGIFSGDGKLIRKIGGTMDTIYGVTVDDDGNIHLLYYHYEPLVYDESMTAEEWNEAISRNERDMRIEVLDPSGNTLKTILLDVESEGWQPWDASLKILEDGTYSYSTNGMIYLIDQQGHQTRTLSDLGRSLKGDIIEKNGKHYVMSMVRDLENGDDYQIKEVDLKTGALGTGIEAGNLSVYGNITVTRDGVFLNSYSGCFKYDIETQETQEVFNWNDTDVDRALMKDVQCTPKSENEILAVGHQSYQFDYPYLIHLTRAETNPHAGKKMIVIGGEHLDKCKDLQSFASIYSGNAENSSRIVFLDYTDGLRAEEGLGNIEQSIYFDTITGAGPDILVNMYDSLAFRTDAIMEDMNQYFDGDSGIDRDDYFNNIFRACETDGKLYHIPVRFQLDGLVVNADYVHNNVGWTFEEFEEASTKMPDQVSFLEGVLYNELMKLMLGTSISQFVDYPNKKVDFQNEVMARILEMVRDFGVSQIPSDEGYYKMYKDFGTEGRLEGDGDRTMEKFMEGMLAIRLVDISSVYDVSAARSQCPGIDVSFLGYPAKEKTGMAVEPTLSIGICAASKSKGLAWDFIKAFMEYEIHNGYSEYDFSVNKAIFESDCQYIMRDRNDFYATFATTPKMVRYIAHPVAAEDIDTVRDLVENTSISTGGDPVIFDILCEEAAAYFAGDRTVEEVLKNVQNRATLVVMEQ